MFKAGFCMLRIGKAYFHHAFTLLSQRCQTVLSLYSYTDYWFNSELIIQANLVILYVLYKLFLHYWIFFWSPSLSERT